MKLISKLTLSVQGEHVKDYDIIIKGISAYNETELIVVHRNSLTTSKLVFVDASEESLSVTRSIELDCYFFPYGVTACRGFIFVTDLSHSVKKLDSSSNFCWSLSNDEKGKPLFPIHLTLSQVLSRKTV